MMLNYQQFYNKNGIRHASNLMSPPLHSVGELYLPLNGVYHHLSTDEETIGVTPDDPVMRLVKSDVVVEHVSDLPKDANLKGRLVTRNLQVASLVNDYHRSFNRYRRMLNSNNLLKTPQTLWVVNYNLLERHYTYTVNIRTEYDKWMNNLNAVVDKINHIALNSDRQHFLLIDIPSRLPTMPQLKLGADNIDKNFNERFRSDEAKFILAMWDWLGAERPKSTLSGLTEKAYKNVNVILKYRGTWTVVSLGVLDGWRLESTVSKDTRGRVAGNILQQRFLRLLLSVVESASDNAGDVEVIDAPVAEVAGNVTGKKKSLVDIINAGQTSKSSVNEQTTDEVDETLPDEDVLDDKAIQKDLEAMSVVADAEAEEETLASVYKHVKFEEVLLEDAPVQIAEQLAKRGQLTAAELRRIAAIAKKYKDLPNPFGDGTLSEFAAIDPATLVVHEVTPLATDIKGVLDKSMLSSSIKDLDNRYIKTVLNKDIVNTCLQLQRCGIMVTGYTVTHTEDINDSFDTHVVNLTPVRGKPSTIRFQVPRVKEDGTFKAGGVINHMRKQRGDKPIRKTHPDTVALTSYYSKMFVVRSEKAVFSYSRWLLNKIITMGINKEDDRITDMRMGKAFNHELDLPRAYTAIASKVTGFTSSGFEFNFNYGDNLNFFGTETMASLGSAPFVTFDFTPVAKSKTAVLLMRKNGTILEVSHVADTDARERGTLEDVIKLDTSNRPIDIAEVAIFGKDIGLGFLLGFHVGLGNLITTLGAKVRRVPKGGNYDIQSHEYALKFNDETLIFTRDESVNSLVFAGFNKYHRELKRYSVYDFDKKEVYANILSSYNIGVRWIREFDLIFKMWVDPITHDLLLDMQEPTNLFSLFMRSCDLLTTDKHPREMDMLHMRDKGYERISGMIYFELVKALRAYNSKPSMVNASIDVNPMSVWMTMLQDQTVRPVDQSNPIQAMKDKEVVIFSGAGGRSGQSMTASSRVFDKNAIGVVSESTVDSGDVATITYLTADPNYNSLRGTTRLTPKPRDSIAKVISTSFLLAPGADEDEGKRINFINIQNSQTTHCVASTAMPSRTGYERVMAHRADENYAKVAKGKGVVTAISDKVVTIQYDGETETVSYPIGRQFGAWGGVTVPHDLACDLKLGDRLDTGDVILYSSQYFVRDTLDPKQVLFKTSVLARVVLWESVDTLEDSDAISREFAAKLATLNTETRYITVKFDEEVRNLIKVGESVTPESILCTIHPATMGGADIFDDEAIQTLQTLSANSPLAKTLGRVDKIDVLYTGEIEEMSSSLRKLVEKSDYEMHKYRKQLKQRTVDGYVEPGYRAGSTEAGMNTVIIKVYITGLVSMDVGDKCVFGNQMKSIVGRVLEGVNESEDEVAIDAIFGYQSVINRVVNSAEKIGTTNSILVHTGELAVLDYESET